MLLKFNQHKGFLIDDENAGNVLDIKKNLTKISSYNETISRKKSKNDQTGCEYRTCGFDLLGHVWESGEYDSDDLDEGNINDFESTIDRYGTFFRDQNYILLSQNTSDCNDDLSSHQSLYGNSVLDITNESKDKAINKKSKKTTKMSVEERKELRKQTRVLKANAKTSRRTKKSSGMNKHIEESNGASLSTSKSKVNHLKYLMEDCIKEAESQSGSKLDDTSRILQIDDVSITVNDLKNLLDDEWLSDSNIGWVYAFLYHGYILPLLSTKMTNSKFCQFEEDNKIFKSPICLLLPTFTFLIANHPEPRELLEAKVLPTGIEDAQFIFCPLNDNDDFGSSEGGSHWSLVVFTRLLIANDFGKSFVQKALVFDSMFEANFSETKRLVSNMAQVLYKPENSKYSTKWDIVHIREAPQQTNGSDCGVFVCAVTAFLVSELVALVNAPPNFVIDLSLSNLRFSALDARIWMLSTLFNCIKNRKKNLNEKC